ncbi:ATP-binding cassette domain-containing protein [uncultured Desulfobulbus sp.]|uniref:peptidase domain-containing ABC transporter n=1 Tax=uncultured Desulfobulbus sp. TaxID=239745 RepID=UPI0029C91C76|nr:ATP-binding cassette domain-containing protein [uncultured Desulfobulbus sp.]
MSGEAMYLKTAQSMRAILEPPGWLGLDRISPFARALPFLLAALGWQSGISRVCESLPHMPGELDRVDLINTMINLGFHARSTRIRLHHFDQRLAPCLFIADDRKNVPGMPLVLIPGPEESGLAKVYNPADESMLSLTDLPDQPGTLYVFSSQSKKLIAQNRFSANVDASPFRWFRSLTRRFDSIFLQTFGVSFLINILALASSLFVMVVYDKVIGSRSVETLEHLVVGALIAMIMETCLRYLRARSLAYFGVRIDAITSQAIFERLLFLPPRLIEGSSIPSQVARMRDFDSIREFFTGSTSVSVLELPFTLIFITVIGIIGGPLAFIPIALALCYIALAMIMLPRIQASTEHGAVASVQRQALLVETMKKNRAIKYHGLGETWLQRFREVSGEAALTSFSSSFLTSIIEAVAYGLSILAGVMTLTYGIWLVWQGQITTGALIASMMLVWRVLSPLQAICNSLVRIRYIFRSVAQVHKLIKTPPESSPSFSQAQTIKINGQITFTGVGLRYTGDRGPILAGLNLDIQPGEIIAITGASGAGKTSLLKLANGLYQPQIGSILIDRLDIRQRDPVELRKCISYVPQVVELFHGTIEKNLRMVKPDASDQELHEALALAGALEEVNALPAGLNTFIGDYRSDQLSSSLAFQLSLARGYLRDAPIMLFDEFPSAVLYGITGQRFREFLNLQRGRKTILYITERRADVLLADRLVYLPGNGQVLAGKPAELLDSLQS